MSKPATVSVGGVWEFDGWEVQFAHAVQTYRSKYTRMVNGVLPHAWSPWAANPCPHAVNDRRGGITHHTPDRFSEESWEESRAWTIPCVVVAYNEAGHNSTGVCLDCIVEWAAANPTS